MDFYGTLGPSCQAEEILWEMCCQGMTGVRLNLSHVTLEQSEELIRSYWRAAERAGIVGKLMIDIQGPELRVGALEQSVTLAQGQSVVLGDKGIPVPPVLLAALEKDVEVLLDDGALLLRVTECHEERAVCTVLRGGVLAARKSIAVPQLDLHPPTLTTSDLENLRVAGQYDVTGVLLPFVRGKEDLLLLGEALSSFGLSHINIMAKIENRKGVAVCEELFPHCHEICIARGDLGNDMPLWMLPATQKQIAATCNALGKPFSVATQMLHSMIREAVPTRAEVSDIFNAVLDGASSLILTGETAVGSYPVAAIQYLCSTAAQAMEYRNKRG